MSEDCPSCGNLVTGSKCKSCGLRLYDENQCANCGYYDAEKNVRWDTDVEKELNFSTFEFVGQIIVQGGLSLFFAFVLSMVLNGLLSILGGQQPYIGYFSLAVSAILWILFMYTVAGTMLKEPKGEDASGPANSPWSVEREVLSREISSVRYKCNECGNRWRVR